MCTKAVNKLRLRAPIFIDCGSARVNLVDFAMSALPSAIHATDILTSDRDGSDRAILLPIADHRRNCGSSDVRFDRPGARAVDRTTGKSTAPKQHEICSWDALTDFCTIAICRGM